MNEAPRKLDGNAVAGPLTDVFSFDVTTVRCTCAQCGATAVLAEYHVYMDAPGTVVRCPACGAAVLRVAQTPGRTWLDLRGSRVLEITAPDAEGPGPA